MSELPDPVQVPPDMDGATPWDTPAVAAAQRAIADQEIAEWRAGKPWPHIEALRHCFAQAQPRSVLDVGCASGYFADLFTEWTGGGAYQGVDTSASALALARTRHPHLAFSYGDQRALPALAGAADLVFHGCCMIHLAESDWPQAVMEAARVSRRWVLFHKTPVRPNWRVTETLWHDAYDTKIRETYIAAAAWRSMLMAAKLVVVQTHVLWRDQDPEYLTQLARVTR